MFVNAEHRKGRVISQEPIADLALVEEQSELPGLREVLLRRELSDGPRRLSQAHVVAATIESSASLEQ
jgi:hypothetical protein